MANDNEIARARKVKQRRIRRKRITAVLLALIVITAAITAISVASTVLNYDIKDFFNMLITFGSFPVETENGLVREKAVSGRCIFLLNDRTLDVVSGSGAKLMEYSHGIANPGLAVSGSRAVVFSRGGKSFKLFSRTMLLYSGASENQIIDAAVTQSGKTALLTAGDEYASELAVYSRNCEKLFTWYGADGFPIGVFPSSYGNDVMVAGVESRDGVLYTRFTRIDLNSRAEKASFELEGLAVKAFPDQDSAVIVMDDRCVLCSNDGTVSETVPFDGKTVLNIFSDPGKDIVIAFGDNRRNEINCFTVFTRKLSTAGTVDYRDQIDDVWMSGDRVFILTRDHISAYSHSGVLEEIYHCDFSTYSFVYFGGLIAFEPKYLVKLSRENREVVDKA